MCTKYTSFFFSFFFLLGFTLYAQSKLINKEKLDTLKVLTKADSITMRLNDAAQDTSRVKLLNDLGVELLTKNEYALAKFYLSESKTLAEKLHFKNGIAGACSKLGNAFWAEGDYDTALKNWLAAIRIWEQTGYKKGVAIMNSNIGILYNTQNQYKKAITYYENSLKIAKSIDDKKTMAMAYHNIGNTYSREAFFSGNREEKINKNQLAQENATKAALLMQESGDKRGEAAAYGVLGDIYYDLGNIAESKKEANAWYQKDLFFQFKAIELHESIGNKLGVAICYSSVGIVNHMMDNVQTSEDYINKALALYTDLGYVSGIKESYDHLRQLAEEKGDFKTALEYQKLSGVMKDSLLNERTTGQIMEMEAKYQNEKKQIENEALAQKNENLSQQSHIQDLQLKQRGYLIVGLLLVALLIAGMAFLFIRQNKTKALYEKSEMEQKLLRSQMNPHFIFNAMVGIQNYIYKEEPEIAANYLSSVVQLMRSIIDNSKKEYVTLDKEVITLQHYLKLQQVRFPGKFDFTIDTDPEIDPEYVFIPPMMAQPCIENAIVHGILNKENSNGRISVVFKKEKDSVLLSIEDNGVGREKAKSFGKKEEEHLSIATTITEERLKILNRKGQGKNTMTIEDLKDDSGQPSGTRVTFLFSLDTAEFSS